MAGKTKLRSFINTIAAKDNDKVTLTAACGQGPHPLQRLPRFAGRESGPEAAKDEFNGHHEVGDSSSPPPQ